MATITATEDCEVCYTEFNADSCTAELCVNISITSVDENGCLPWQFMPNPATEALRVCGGEATLFDVLDLNGRRVYTATVYRGVTTLDLSRLQPGRTSPDPAARSHSGSPSSAEAQIESPTEKGPPPSGPFHVPLARRLVMR